MFQFYAYFKISGSATDVVSLIWESILEYINCQLLILYQTNYGLCLHVYLMQTLAVDFILLSTCTATYAVCVTLCTEKN